MCSNRETLSLLRFYHWQHSFWNGRYAQLIKWWGWRSILGDSWDDLVSLVKRGRTMRAEYRERDR